METKVNNVNSEETLVDDKQINYSETENKSNKKIVAAGIGVMTGVAGAFGYNALRAAPEIEEDVVASKLGESTNSNIVSNPNMEEPDNLDEIEIAVSPDDEMSFQEAFAAARKEVGPNGVFEWRGSIFSTYYKEEWDNLSDEYKEDFGKYNWKEKIGSSEEDEINEPVYENDDIKAEDTENIEQDVARFEIKNDENGNEYIALKDAITGDEIHISPDEFGLAVTDEKGEVIAFLTNDYLDEHPEPNGVIQFDADGNCIPLDTADYTDSDDLDGEFVPEPLDDDVEVLNFTEENDVVVPEEFEGDYAVVNEDGEIVGDEVSTVETDEIGFSDDACADGIPEIDENGEIVDDSII